MSQPPIQAPKEVQVLDINVEKCGTFTEDANFKKVREEIDKQLKEADGGINTNITEKNRAADQKDQKAKKDEDDSYPNEAVFFQDNVFQILADFKTIPFEEIYCKVSERCVEVGAIHKETVGAGPSARHLDLQLTRLYQTPKAINTSATHCYVSSDGTLLVTGPYIETKSQQSSSK